MTPRLPAAFRVRAWRRALGVPGVVLAVMVGAAACSAQPAPAPGTPAAAATPGTASPSAAPGAASPSATTSVPPTSPQNSGGATVAGPEAAQALQVRQKVQGALETLVRSSAQPSREQVRAALSAPDFDPAAVEVTASQTPTGLGVEAVEAAVLTAGQCAVAQVRSGTVEVSLLPVLSNGRCFLGTNNK